MICEYKQSRGIRQRDIVPSDKGSHNDESNGAIQQRRFQPRRLREVESLEQRKILCQGETC